MPAQLRAFYQEADGFITPSGHTLYDLSSLKERNETYEVDVYATGYILIGDNSGGLGYLLSTTGDEKYVYSSDMGDMSPKYFQKESQTLEDWIVALE
ncbi:hypothetical protein ACU10_15605 [Xanthomonas oryzae pv. oryzicola]|nr:hypothetical protein ACU13_15680 [Xanthomonas oryzae pv. oryzicola]AKN99072.1 hypothetical protein ACU10_15605 [Xanthomonas oryzae pv. oryzicola]AKO14297.1 hypothetical protein ACU14_15605 [Xanthomonas oryzae pv. oryzicola]AKO18027.1 hypothetical protein ACU12_15665 [Xanthomonas oryzae pv. oryzicola]